MSRTFYDPAVLKAFVVTAREGSVTKAAARLHLSQPAVSLQLSRLADEIGLPIFERAARGLTLTADGAALLPRAEKVLAAMGEFHQAATHLKTDIRGSLRVGTILDPEFTRLGAFLRELVEAAPNLATELRQDISGSVLTLIQDRELDAGFYLSTDADASAGSSSAASALHLLALSRFHYRVVAPAGWDIAKRNWDELVKLPWLATPKQSVHHRLVNGIFDQMGVAPRWVALVDQESSMLDLLRSGVGLSLVRDSIAIRESQAHGLALAERVQLPCTLNFAALNARLCDQPIAAAWAAIKRAWAMN